MRAPSAAHRRQERGLTLIEITVSIAIVAVLLAATVFALDAVTGATAKKVTGQLASTIRGLYDEAALSGRTCRMTFELPDERAVAKDEDLPPVKWHAECAEAGVAISQDRDEELEAATEAAKRKDRGAAKAEEALAVRQARDFSLLDTPTLDEVMAAERARVEREVEYSDYRPPTTDPLEIPPSVRIEVWTRNQKEPVKSGIAYLYFHPQGYTERAHIYVSQGDNVWTIKVSPLTGKTEVVASREEIPR